MRTYGTIEELCHIEYGTRVVKKNVMGNHYPVYGGGGESFRINKFNRNNRLVISRFGMSLKCTRFVEGRFFLNDSGLTLSPKNKNLSQEYLDKLILSLNNKIFCLGKGSAQKNLSMDKFRILNISYPSLEEQKHIVAKIDNSFIEIDKAINCFNKQLIEINNFRYKRIRNLMIDLGNEFGFEPLSGVSSIQPKKKIALEKLNPHDEVSFLNMNSLGIEQKYSESLINKRLEEVYSAYQYFENNDVVFAKITPCFENGKLSIVKNLKNGIGFGSSEFVVLRPKSIIDSEFLYYALLDKRFRIKGKEQMSGAVGHQRVTKDYFYNYKIPTPPIEIQRKMVKILESIWDHSKTFHLSKCKKREELVNLKSCILYQEFQNNSK